MHGHACTLEDHQSYQEGYEADLEFTLANELADGIDVTLYRPTLEGYTNEVLGRINNSYNILAIDRSTSTTGAIGQLLNTNDAERAFEKLSPSQCEFIFEGIDRNFNNTDQVLKVHLAAPLNTLTESEQAIVVSSIISFDIDSFLAIAQSLAIARRGIKVREIYPHSGKQHLLRYTIALLLCTSGLKHPFRSTS